MLKLRLREAEAGFLPMSGRYDTVSVTVASYYGTLSLDLLIRINRQVQVPFIQSIPIHVTNSRSIISISHQLDLDLETKSLSLDDLSSHLVDRLIDLLFL